MFLRLLIESFTRQKRRKLLAGIAILLGTTAVTAMLALATTIGDRIHRELAVYGANIVVTPKADALAVKVGGIDLKPTTGGAYLKESDLEKLHGIFWANNITGISPELSARVSAATAVNIPAAVVNTEGYWFHHKFGNLTTGVLELHPLWKIAGSVPVPYDPSQGPSDADDALVGYRLAARLHLHIGDTINFFPNADLRKPARIQTIPGLPTPRFEVVGIATTNGAEDDALLVPIEALQRYVASSDHNAVSRVEISAKTRPEDAFAREDPATLSPAKHDIWYCRPYANSIAYQIREAIPGADAQQIRRVEQTEGTVLERISGLMWLITAAALLAAGFAVSAAMATAVLERRGEIGLMRSLGASRAAIATLFYAESGLLAILAGSVGYVAGSILAWALGRHIFPAYGAAPLLNLVLLPVVVALALLVAIAGSTPSIRAALSTDPANTLRGEA